LLSFPLFWLHFLRIWARRLSAGEVYDPYQYIWRFGKSGTDLEVSTSSGVWVSFKLNRALHFEM